MPHPTDEEIKIATDFINRYLGNFNVKVENVYEDKEIGTHYLMLAQILVTGKVTVDYNESFNLLKDRENLSIAQSLFLQSKLLHEVQVVEYEDDISPIVFALVRMEKKNFKSAASYDYSKNPEFQDIDNSLKIQLTFGENSTDYSLISSELTNETYSITNEILFNGIKRKIPNLASILYRSINEADIDLLLAGSEFQFVEDVKTHLVALQLKESLLEIISVEYIIKYIVTQIQEKLKFEFNKIAGEALVSWPIIANSYQTALFQQTLIQSGFQKVQLIEPSIVIAANNFDQKGKTLLTISITETHFETSIIRIEITKVHIIRKIGRYSLGLTELRIKFATLLFQKLSEGNETELSNVTIDLLFPFVEELFKYFYGQETFEIQVLLPDFSIDKTVQISKDEIVEKTGDPLNSIQSITEELRSQSDGIDAVCFLGKIFENNTFLNEVIDKQVETQIETVKISSISQGFQNISQFSIQKTSLLEYSIGSETSDDTIHTIFQKGTIIPAKQRTIAKTPRDNQKRIHFRFAQGERKRFSKNSTIGDFLITNLPPRLAQTVGLALTYYIDENGIFSLEAEVLGIGSGKTEFSFQYLVPKLDLDQEENLNDDEKELELLRAKGNLKRIIHNGIYRLKNKIGVKSLDDETIQNLQNEFEEYHQWFHSNESASFDDYVSRSDVLLQKLPGNFFSS